MADPGPVAATFWVDDALESPLRTAQVWLHGNSRAKATEAAARQLTLHGAEAI